MDTTERGAAAAGLMVLAAAAIWGSGGLFIRAAALPAVTMTFFRMVVPAVALGGWFLFRRHRISREFLGTRLVASALNAVRMYFFFLAFEYTTVATATVSLYAWPIFATLFGRLILKERVGRARALLLALAFSGVPLLYLPGGSGAGVRDAIGISAMIFSAMIHALAVVLFRRARSGNSPFETTFFQNVLGAIVFAVIFFVSDAGVAPRQVVIGLSLGAWVGVAGFTLFFMGLHRLGTAGASLLSYAEVVVAVALGTVILGEPLYWNTVVGGAVIILALAMAQGQLIQQRVPG